MASKNVESQLIWNCNKSQELVSCDELASVRTLLLVAHMRGRTHDADSIITGSFTSPFSRDAFADVHSFKLMRIGWAKTDERSMGSVAGRLFFNHTKNGKVQR